MDQVEWYGSRVGLAGDIVDGNRLLDLYNISMAGTLSKFVLESLKSWSDGLRGPLASPPLLVITGASELARTTVGVEALRGLDPGGRRLWREVTYVENFKLLADYRQMARNANAELLQQYEDYERDFYETEATRVLFVDGVGVSGFWPTPGVVSLIRLVEDRMIQNKVTILAIDSKVVERVPGWSRFLDPDGPHLLLNLDA